MSSLRVCVCVSRIVLYTTKPGFELVLHRCNDKIPIFKLRKLEKHAMRWIFGTATGRCGGGSGGGGRIREKVAKELLQVFGAQIHL